MSSVYLASQPASLRGKNLNVRHYMQTAQSNFFIPAMLISIIDMYHFLSFYTAFTDLDLALGSQCHCKAQKTLLVFI